MMEEIILRISCLKREIQNSLVHVMKIKLDVMNFNFSPNTCITLNTTQIHLMLNSSTCARLCLCDLEATLGLGKGILLEGTLSKLFGTNETFTNL